MRSDVSPGEVVHLSELAARAEASDKPGAIWSMATEDLNLNVVRFADGDGVEAHVNGEVDVVGVVVAGTGMLEVDGGTQALGPGDLFLVRKGARRAIRAEGGDLVYLTCHRRRAGLMPKRASR